MYQKQFSYSSNSTELYSLLIYFTFQQYIIKEHGPVWHWVILRL